MIFLKKFMSIVVMVMVAWLGGVACAIGAKYQTNAQQVDNYGATPSKLTPYQKSVDPYRRYFLSPPLFRGPGRDAPAAKVSSIKLGLLAPLKDTPDAAAGISFKQGVELALEEANSQGGYNETPFALVARNDSLLWGSSANTIADLAYTEKVWAVFGSINSNSTHVALRAALKIDIPIINVGATDPTITEHAIPWIIRLTPDDRQTGYRFAKLLFAEKNYKKVAVFRASDRYGRLGVKEFRDAASRLHTPLPLEILIKSGQTDFTSQVARLAATQVDAILLWLRAEEAGLLTRALREASIKQPIFGTDRLVSRRFLKIADQFAEGVTATYWMNPHSSNTLWQNFQAIYRAKFAQAPDQFAVFGYDAANVVVTAIRKKGLNRVLIRDALAEIRSYNGASGHIRLNATANNISPLFLATVVNGRFVFK